MFLISLVIILVGIFFISLGPFTSKILVISFLFFLLLNSVYNWGVKYLIIDLGYLLKRELSTDPFFFSIEFNVIY